MSVRRLAQLPPALLALLDGERLDDKLGETIQLVAAEDGGWPRMALLSVGEVLARSPREIMLALHGSSRTTQAVLGSARALLVVVHDGTLFKIELDASAVDTPSRGSDRYFRCVVRGVDVDAVEYATVGRGITFELVDEAEALRRWAGTVDAMRGLTK